MYILTRCMPMAMFNKSKFLFDLVSFLADRTNDDVM